MTDLPAEGAALLAAVVASDDDAPRLAYASWLRAHGQSERAELIVLQCAGLADRLARIT